MKARFSAIEALLEHFHWKRMNLVGFSSLGSHVSNFGTFAYVREWMVASSLVLNDDSDNSVKQVISDMKKTGKNFVK